MSEAVIEARGLRKAFDGVIACDGVDIAVQPGEIVGLVGPDGAGKTTTMRMLCGIVSADDGEPLIAGHNADDQPEAVHSHLGYLPQTFSLHRHLTVSENIAYMGDLYKIPPDLRKQREGELLQITDLHAFRDRQADRLSGGMRQKLSLVCTLIHQPEALLLDEPTTGVDPVSRREFWKLLYDLPRQGVGILITTPYMDEAARCNMIAFMYQGKILAFDTPQGIRDSIETRFVEVFAEPQRQARQVLQKCPAVESVEVFGDRLHVGLVSEAHPNDVTAALDAHGLHVEKFEEMKPTLEDAFMSLAPDDESR